MLDNGAYTYTYDHANRLSTVSNQHMTASFLYDGLGNRIQQNVDDGVTTNYTLDLAIGLTQVLADGENAYLYGLNRIGEYDTGDWMYHHGDALGSVRQLTDFE